MNSIEEYFLTGLPPALEELKTLFPTLTVECIEPDWLKLSTTKMGKGVDLFFPNGKEIIIKLSKPTMGWWKTKGYFLLDSVRTRISGWHAWTFI